MTKTKHRGEFMNERARFFEGNFKDSTGVINIYPLAYNTESWAAIMMELGFTIFRELELNEYWPADPYTKQYLGYAPVECWTTLKDAGKPQIFSDCIKDIHFIHFT